jgi:SAM-dependent methyltransferase
VRLCLSCGCPFVAVEWRCPECGAEPAVVDGVTMFAPDLAAEGEGFDPELFDTLAALEPHSFWFRARNRLIAWAVTEYFPRASTFLEVGCGTGFVLAGLQDAAPRLSLSGSELFPQAFEYARRRAPNATLYQLDARQIPFVDEWDVIGAFDVLEHIEDDAAALQSIRRALHDGGGLLVTVPQHPQLWSTADEYAHHVRRYRRGELRNKLELAGFRVARMTSFVTLLLPAMALMRYRGRKRSLQAYDPTGEHRVGRLTPVLEGTLEVERMAIRRGWSLPAGGSLLAIAVTDGR